MIYATTTKTFKKFLLTKEKILRLCFPDNAETNLVDLISAFSQSRTVQDFSNLWCDFSKELQEWGNIELTEILMKDFIPVDRRIKFLCDMLGLKHEQMDAIEQYNLKQLLLEM
jgi:hypothetical protein